MKTLQLIDERPPIRKFYRAIYTEIKTRVARSGPEGRPTDGFIYILEGSAHYELKDSALDVKEGDILYLSKHSTYVMTVKSDVYKVLIANFDFFLPDDCVLVGSLSPQKNSKEIEKIFRQLLATWQMQSPTVREEGMSFLYQIYVAFLNSFDSPYISSINRNRINTAVKYINEHIRSENLTVPDVASHVHLSESHFRRLFKETFKISPLQYINLQRITLTKERIAYSSTPLTEIAEEYGFSSVYHFSHTFKKEVGYSPSEYRKRYRSIPKT
ncbi:MAG: helix-turn-helix transcriptional regulator [Clostridia bacterium]|nr:helix-turn-helix transcriptional regulator [Clostridia bacterium]